MFIQINLDIGLSSAICQLGDLGQVTYSLSLCYLIFKRRAATSISWFAGGIKSGHLHLSSCQMRLLGLIMPRPEVLSHSHSRNHVKCSDKCFFYLASQQPCVMAGAYSGHSGCGRLNNVPPFPPHTHIVHILLSGTL